jgi:hypothetical protein
MFMGCNLIGGWAHARDLIYVSKLVKAYHEDWRVFRTLHMAEAAGMNTIILNPGLFRVMGDYQKKEGGKIQVLSDCAIGGDPVKGAQESIKFGAQMLYIPRRDDEKVHHPPRRNYKIIRRTPRRHAQRGLPGRHRRHSWKRSRSCVARGLVSDFWVKDHPPDQLRSAHSTAVRTRQHWCTNPDVTNSPSCRPRPERGSASRDDGAGAVEPRRAFPSRLKASVPTFCAWACTTLARWRRVTFQRHLPQCRRQALGPDKSSFAPCAVFCYRDGHANRAKKTS